MKPNGFFIITAMFLLASCSAERYEADYRIVPLPDRFFLTGNEHFEMNSRTGIVADTADPRLRKYSEMLQEIVTEGAGLKLKTYGNKKRNYIRLKINLDSGCPEGYNIVTSGEGITLTGNSEAGLFYAIQTLRKSMPARSKSLSVTFPAVEIYDCPRFPYRGVMLDAARTWFEPDSVKRIIDLLALHNLNRFHWHLTDDQGWRIEIMKYPELTLKGSQGTDIVSGERFGGYYTREDIRDIVSYAAERHITVIPEIDLPGHVMAALASYPELGCTGGPYEVTSEGGIRRDVLCVGKDGTMEFARNVLEEVMELFPSEYIHIGGDECPRDRWKECPLCQRRIKEEGIGSAGSHSAEDNLQGWFNKEISSFLRSHGRKMLGWDEIMEGELPEGATVMVWRDPDSGRAAAARGHDVITAWNSSLYLSCNQTLNVDHQMYPAGGYIPIRKVYDTEPVPEGTPEESEHHVRGVEACIWTSSVTSGAAVEYFLLPRMAALSEIAWTDPRRKNFRDFVDRARRMIPFYFAGDYKYGETLFEITGSVEPDYVQGTVNVVLSSFPDAVIRYSLDGELPRHDSPIYTGPIVLNNSAVVSAAAFLPDGWRSDYYIKEVSFNKATACPVENVTLPEPGYPATALNDGARGALIFNMGGWAGYRNNDLEVIIDLRENTVINEVTVSTLTDVGAHIMEPVRINVFPSTDRNFKTKISYIPIPDADLDRKKMTEHRIEIPAARARFVKIHVVQARELPRDHINYGDKPFLFVDEIIVN